MTHEQLVEKVARAICDDDHKGGDFGMMGIDAWEVPRGREVYIARARAAIAAIYEAMREPSAKMVTAARERIQYDIDPPPFSSVLEACRAAIKASPLKGE